jgi:hypothetical protein
MVEMKYCPQCGQVIPPRVKLPRYAQRLYDYIASHPAGVTGTQVLGAIYWDRPDGGPDDRKIVHVMVNQTNKRLRQYGLVINSRTPGRLYRLQQADMS